MGRHHIVRIAVSIKFCATGSIINKENYKEIL